MNTLLLFGDESLRSQRRLRNHRIPKFAKGIMNMLQEQHKERKKMQEELLNNEHNRRILDDIHLDLLRRIRNHRIPKFSKGITHMLQEQHKERKKMQDELLEKVHAMENLLLMKKTVFTELLIKLKDREEKRRRDRIHKEMRDKAREIQIWGQIKSYGYKELMTYQIEKPVGDNDFLPRKMFFFGIDVFNCKSKPVESVCIVPTGEDKATKSEAIEQSGQNHKCIPKPKKPKTALKSRLKIFLRMTN